MKGDIRVMKNNKSIVYTLATMAGICFVSGIVILTK